MLPILKRLKDRKIVQWAVAYFAGAWLLLEAFDLVAEQFLWPVWVRQGATVIVLFGLLVTLVLAWNHGERGRQKAGLFEVTIIAVLMALAGQSLWVLKDRSEQLTDNLGEEPSRFRNEPLPRHSVAVLPCLNMSNDENQGYFADSLAAELITRLAAVGGLRIPSHTSSFSFRGKNMTINSVAASLKVRHVLECDVSGDETRIRIGARLIDAESGYTLWSESYNHLRSKLFEVQAEVVQSVVEVLEVRLGDRERQLVYQRWTDNAEAYDAFLRGIESQLGFPTEARLSDATQYLERAIELDPDFGRAYARLAMNWIIESNFGYKPTWRASAEVFRLSRKALALDEDLSEAHWALGWAQFGMEYDWEEAEFHFRKTITLAPGEWFGYHSLGFLQGVLGHYDEAMTAALIATDLDPMAYYPRRGIEFLHFRQRDYEASIKVALEMATRRGWNPFLRARLARLLFLAGREEQARIALIESEASGSRDVNVQLYQAIVYALLGEHDRALALAEPWRLKQEQNPDQVLSSTLSFVYANLGMDDLAMELLLEGRERKEIELLFLDDPSWDRLRDDARFVKLVRDLELPEEIYLSMQ